MYWWCVKRFKIGGCTPSSAACPRRGSDSGTVGVANGFSPCIYHKK